MLHKFFVKFRNSWKDNIKIDHKYDVKVLTELITPGYSPMAGLCEQGNEILNYVKDREFLEHLSDCQLLENSSFIT
jgi:hypothetical protein